MSCIYLAIYVECVGYIHFYIKSRMQSSKRIGVGGGEGEGNDRFLQAGISSNSLKLTKCMYIATHCRVNKRYVLRYIKILSATV